MKIVGMGDSFKTCHVTWGGGMGWQLDGVGRLMEMLPEVRGIQ